MLDCATRTHPPRREVDVEVPQPGAAADRLGELWYNKLQVCVLLLVSWLWGCRGDASVVFVGRGWGVGRAARYGHVAATWRPDDPRVRAHKLDFDGTRPPFQVWAGAGAGLGRGGGRFGRPQGQVWARAG